MGASRRIIENKKADVKSAFDVCPLFGATTLFTSSEACFAWGVYALTGFPIHVSLFPV